MRGREQGVPTALPVRPGESSRPALRPRNRQRRIPADAER